MKHTLSLLLATGLLAACGDGANNSTETAAKEAADMIISGGPIYTALDSNPMVEAVAVKNGRIIFAGSADKLATFKGPDTQSINLQGTAMYPGFTDAHAHLLGIGFRELTLNLEDISSIEELKSTVAASVAEASEGAVVTGRGWIETHWPEGRFPNRQDLDAVAPDHAVILRRADGHASVVNSKALELAGITGATESPFGGDILKDEAGEPTGMLIDTAQGLVGSLTQAPTPDEIRHAYSVASDVYASYGWTNIHSMSVHPNNVPVMESLSDQGELDIRVYNSIDGKNPKTLELFQSGGRASDNGKVVTRAIKLYMDGALGSRGAALLEPYSDADTSGLMMAEEEDYLPIFTEALKAGIQVNTHAIGDKGNRYLLDWYKKAFDAVPVNERKVADPRWRDEHTQIVNWDDINRFKELGVIPSMQPSHAIGDLYFAPDRLGTDRLKGAYAWQSLIDSGVIIAGGSDAPVERGDPRIEFYGATIRQSIDGFSNENWFPEEAVSRQDALKMFTIWPAYAAFQENDLGTIEVGKLADFTVFSKDIMTIAGPEILKVDPIMTIVGGEVVYHKGQ